MSLQVFVNGKFVDAENATVSVWDHGFLYGDGVFEGVRAYNGRAFRLQEHVRRLYESAHSIRLDIPMAPEEMCAMVIDACRRNEIVDGYVRICVSRGKGDLGLDPRKCSQPTIVIIADRIKLYSDKLYNNGLKLIISSVRRIPPEAMDSKIKSLNYLNNILAKIEANSADADEAVMINVNGFVTECTAENIFTWREGVLRTPGAYVGILEGVTRGVVIELAKRAGIQVEETMLNAHDLFVADEVFLTGTGAELIPVIEIAGRRIGNGKPGPVYRRLLQDFQDLTRREGSAIYAGLEKDENSKPTAAQGLPSVTVASSSPPVKAR